MPSSTAESSASESGSGFNFSMMTLPWPARSNSLSKSSTRLANVFSPTGTTLLPCEK